jgi:hypothetical protein
LHWLVVQDLELQAKVIRAQPPLAVMIALVHSMTVRVLVRTQALLLSKH